MRRAVVIGATLWPGVAAAAGSGTTDRWPMLYLFGAGTRASETAPLLWGLLVLSIVVVVIISALVLVGTLRRARRGTPEPGERMDVARTPGALRWIYGGLIATTLALAVFTVWTMGTLAAISAPPEKPAFTVEIIGHQWWWEVKYHGPDDDPSRGFETANEIHVPVGETVRLRLVSADVIHSFWIPALSGKTDVIPGTVNETWIRADEPGVYRGQCSEYCGPQHANMSMLVKADEPGDFAAWWDGQVALQQAPQTAKAERGQRVFFTNCGVCHTVRGTLAGGQLGPDLTHLMSRSTIAANMLPNTIGHLSGWIANPQGIKPHALMPNLDLSGPQLAALRDYLVTLK